MINIVFELNDKFARHCAAAMVSILINHKNMSDDDKIHFFLLSNLKQANKEKILSLKNDWDFECSFISVDESLFVKLPLDNKSPTLYYRLLIPEILPKSIEKVIHLDCDLIVNTDIEKLWNINIERFLIAAVLDEPRQNQKKEYVNAGVVVYNLKNLREFNFDKKWRDYADRLSPKTKLQYYDQDILNDIINERVFLLEPNWNVEKYNMNLLLEQDEENLGRMIYSFYIIHYTTQAKPWLPFSNHLLKYMYIKCAKLTPWSKKVGNYSIFYKAVYLTKILLKYWFIHPLFFIRPKFWSKIKTIGFIETIN